MSDDLDRPPPQGLSREERRREAIDHTAAVVERDIRKHGGTSPPRDALRDRVRGIMDTADRKEQSR